MMAGLKDAAMAAGEMQPWRLARHESLFVPCTGSRGKEKVPDVDQTARCARGRGRNNGASNSRLWSPLVRSVKLALQDKIESGNTIMAIVW
jgi:hypothetical protein